MYKFIVFLLTIIAVVTVPSICMAQYYGNEGGQVLLIVDKKIRSLNWNQFYDNIDSSQKVFVEGEGVEFKIKVSNNGNQTINNIQAADYLPKYLCLVFYPGTVDNNALFWNIPELKAGENKDYLIRAKICGLPKEIKKEKETNQAYIKAEDMTDRDYASYYVGKKTTPTTGPNSLVVESVLVGLTMVAAFRGRKLARGY